MHRNQPRFKNTQVFDWESEPHDERPSEFAQSTGYSALSGLYVPEQSRPRRRRQGGVNMLLVGAATVVALSIVALLGFIHLLRA